MPDKILIGSEFLPKFATNSKSLDSLVLLHITINNINKLTIINNSCIKLLVESTCIKLYLISATESARTSQKDKEFIDIDGISDRGSLNAILEDPPKKVSYI